MKHPLDQPIVVNNIFHPRKIPMPTHSLPHHFDGRVDIETDVNLGYRLHIYDKSYPLLVYFHGNGEIVTDYEPIAPLYFNSGVNLIVFDYRAYGWSTGEPSTTQLLPDALKCIEALPTILEQADINKDISLFLKGRSLGGAPAIFLAQHLSNYFRGLITESAYSDAPSVFSRMGLSSMLKGFDQPTLPLYNKKKMSQVTCPTPIIHGASDRLIPVTHAHQLYDACGADDKQLFIIPNAGHNDLIFRDQEGYFGQIKQFIADYK